MSVRRLLAAGVLVPLLLTGCQESKAEPKPKLPEETTSTPSETAEPAPKGESAEEFIRRWVAAADKAQTTGDVTGYVEMSPQCRPCRTFATNVERVYENGGSAEYPGSEVRRIEKVGAKPPTFTVTQYIPETIIHHGDSGETETLPAGTTRVELILERSSDHWTVAHVLLLR